DEGLDPHALATARDVLANRLEEGGPGQQLHLVSARIFRPSARRRSLLGTHFHPQGLSRARAYRPSRTPTPGAGALLAVSGGRVQEPSTPPAIGHVRAVSYNVRRCVGLDGRESVDRIAAVLEPESADVIALQEVLRHEGGLRNQASIL